MTVAPNTPCLVGAAQYVGRTRDPAAGLSPADMLAEVARRALVDAGKVSASDIDTVAIVRLFADSGPAFASPFGAYRNLPWSVARRIGATDARAVYGPVGGNTPQMLVNHFAEAIWNKEADIALIAGGEALRTQARAAKAGLDPEWGEDAPAPPETPFPEARLLTRHELAHGIAMPVNVYPLFETAYGAKKGWSLAEHRAQIGRLMSGFTDVAANNPYAQAGISRAPGELTEETAENRMISWPYTKYLVSNMFVDQAGAVLLMSAARADALGIARDRRVYLHGSADTAEKTPSEREDLARCPAIEMGARHALSQAGVAASDLGPVDLYSCFPVAVEIAAEAIGLPTDRPKRLTMTGGLPYFGGPGNAYSLHGIAEVYAACRNAPQDYGLVFANGGYLSKHSFGVYSARPGYAPRVDPATYQADLDALPSRNVDEAPSGAGTIEAYTVVHGRGGAKFAIVIGEGKGRRFLAQMTSGLDRLTQANAVGQRITVTSGDPVNEAVFE
ncbi:acetyl-CoA acetyltransferase [Pacificimonas sp. WHA3]|uniref:Acetyl-CoA acetyltransferase n=1 Tax=Pacificimonas pallii TaxID=2827236 RepID=A0ABS6SH52_9SPHN|nr:acetyl-CoA acetyltransferase [Pacificimonas pallii]MBV7257221.1 acetyl-CoA acetyltransferase [Pacificimonas pallii]